MASDRPRWLLVAIGLAVGLLVGSGVTSAVFLLGEGEEGLGPASVPAPGGSPVRPGGDERTEVFSNWVNGTRLVLRVEPLRSRDPGCATGTFPDRGIGRPLGAYRLRCRAWERAGLDVHLYFVTLRNIDDSPRRFRLSSFVLVTRGDGESYAPLSLSDRARFSQAFIPDRGTIAPRSSVQGWVAFDAKLEFVASRLSYVDGDETLTVAFVGPHRVRPAAG